MKCSKCGKEIVNIQTASCISGYDENGKHENWLCEKCSFEWDKEHPCCPIDYVKKSIINFVCKKCGSTAYEIKDKANGTGIAHGLYCAKCGFWHKWLGKEELKQYAKKESKDEIIAKLQTENAELRARLDKAVELPRIEISQYDENDTLLYYIENGHIQQECFNNKFPEQLQKRLAELKGKK